MSMQHTEWAKSSYSGGSGEACVERRHALEGGAVAAVDIRDSKDVANSPVITVSPSAWAAFVGLARS
ncbi:DUF397 domain-containing protein [Streptomyces griseoaurantiacus]|uniref:DUF397 domain-containing protein n=1 Tax=Streptomyces griseoaurantiacus TaxID=68213 RepID=UPI003695A4D9